MLLVALVTIAIVIEIAVTAGLLWMFFKLSELHPKFKLRSAQWLELLQDKRELLEKLTQALAEARAMQGKWTGRWQMLAGITVKVIEKCSTASVKAKA